MTQDRAYELYEGDPQEAIEFIKDNWWWISFIGERLYVWIMRWIKRRKDSNT